MNVTIDQINFWLNIIVCLGAVSCLIFAVKSPNDRARYGQTAVVLGIFGTFAGITLGLVTFDPKDIDGSVPSLLSGLQTAFITSLCGQIVSLTINSNTVFGWIFKLTGGKPVGIPTDSEGRPKEADIGDILIALNSIKNSIVGDGESTMITQIQKMRTSTYDALSELNQSFKEYSKHMVENTNNAIVEALKEVIRDFNAKINEQFGDNFKQLNDGVAKLVVWQENYKGFVTESEQELRKTIQFVEKSVIALERASVSLAAILETASVMTDKTVEMTEANTQAMICIDEFGESIGSLKTVAEQSQNLFPSLERNVVTTLTGAEQLVKNVSEKIGEQATTLNQNYETTRKMLESLINQTQSNLEKQVTKLDEELGKELTKSLVSLGNQLASLSTKFVQDYSPLADKLRLLVESARRP